MLKVRTRIAVGIADAILYWDPDTDGSPGDPRQLLVFLENREFLENFTVQGDKVYCIRQKGYRFIEVYPITQESKVGKADIDTLPQKYSLGLAVLGGQIYYSTTAGEIWRYSVESDGLKDTLVAKGSQNPQGVLKTIGNKLVNLGPSFFDVIDPASKTLLKTFETSFPIFYTSSSGELRGVVSLGERSITLYSPEGKELRTLAIRGDPGTTSVIEHDKFLFIAAGSSLYKVFPDNTKVSKYAGPATPCLLVTKKYVLTGGIGKGSITFWTHDLVKVKKLDWRGPPASLKDLRDGRILVSDTAGKLSVLNPEKDTPDSIFSINFSVFIDSAVLPPSQQEVQAVQNFLRVTMKRVPVEIANIVAEFI